jgi:hypothetical protein
MATDLWPIIHRLSHLLDVKREIDVAESSGNTSKATVFRTELESTANAIELALNNWAPSLSSVSGNTDSIETGDSAVDSGDFSMGAPKTADLKSILHNAEAYRQAALVYLYHEIKEFPRTSEKVQRHVKLALQACDQVAKWAGPMSALLWPMFISASQAVSIEDREIARRTFAAVDR